VVVLTRRLFFPNATSLSFDSMAGSRSAQIVGGTGGANASGEAVDGVGELALGAPAAGAPPPVSVHAYVSNSTSSLGSVMSNARRAELEEADACWYLLSLQKYYDG
jgi:hypothetical protein